MKQKIITFLAVALCLFTSGSAQAEPVQESIQETFQRANFLFRDGKYEAAKEAYESILAKGQESGPLYYNLGNVEFKLGGLSRAILNYERAKRFMPRDGDLRANLEFARSQLENPLTPKKRLLIFELFYRIADNFTLDELSGLTYFLYFALFLLLSLFVLSKRRFGFLKQLIIFMLILLIIFGVAFGEKFFQVRLKHEAIIIVRDIDCKFAPAENAVTYLRLFGGTKIDVLSKTGDWARIKTPDARIGWIRGSAFEQIED